MSFHRTDKWGTVLGATKYYDPDPEDDDSGRITLEFDKLMKIQETAVECMEDREDKNAWCQDIVKPMLKTVLHKPQAPIWREKSV